ncbi:MAG: Lrp/AsnC family transcriptional regulator [Candidatus Marinimicrobia bacterium]|nr:Lrp/AsnC family transcriptional regulator [Candidatus Neomarinimicrobiota bacterium]MCF7904600.1 Lrp/AsnC family transcriptional regulator [Candidatus Neomarinimicrobiota bacterium]
MVDERDIQILEILQDNGRATASEISKVIELSVPAVAERMKKLSETGLIKGYATIVDPKLAGLDLTAFVFIVSEHSDNYQDFVQKAKESKAVMECHSIMGQGSHILKVRTKNSQALEDLLYEIQNWPGVNRTQSNLVLSSYKETSSIDLKELLPK